MSKNYIRFWAFISFFLMITLPTESISQMGAKLQITSNLRILEPPPYRVGQSITAEFSIRNMGAAPITLDVLTVGGRLNGTCPQTKCPDFEFKPNISLPPNVSYAYRGKLTLQAPGNYHFFTAYRTKDGQWNTAIPTSSGVINTVDITVSSQSLLTQDEIKVLEESKRKQLELRAPTIEDCISTRTRQIYDEKVKKNLPVETVIREGQVTKIPFAPWVLKNLWEQSKKEAEEECKRRQ